MYSQRPRDVNSIRHSLCQIDLSSPYGCIQKFLSDSNYSTNIYIVLGGPIITYLLKGIYDAYYVQTLSEDISELPNTLNQDRKMLLSNE